MNENFFSQLNNINLNLDENKLKLLKKYCDMVIEGNKKFNLVSNADFNTIMLEHIADSLSFSMVKINEYKIANNFKMMDIGAGGGFPGVPIGILNPDANITLTESINKKCLFLKEIADEFKDINFNVINERLEIVGNNSEHREKYDIVTARALSNINTLLEYALPLVKIGGIFVAYKTENTIDELKETSKALKILGGKVDNIIKYDFIDKDLKRALIIIKKVNKTNNKYPRQVGIPLKKPLK
ncbi:MAG: 16S rRNA (guanine(527)-N(7))-methyltransferase RsmG [Vampirovibrionia bacterium]